MKDQEWWDHQQYIQSENIAPKTRNTSQENLRNYIKKKGKRKKKIIEYVMNFLYKHRYC
jgi:SOS response regulatory protein OraA/RecX